MDLTLESGSTISGVTEEDILPRIEGEAFAILSSSSESYMQCAAQKEAPGEYVLEYQSGSLDEHYRVAGRLALGRVQSAFVKYLRGDLTWMSDLRWEKISPPAPGATNLFDRPERRPPPWKRKYLPWTVLGVLLALLFITVSERDRHNAELLEQRLAATRAIEQFSSSYRSFDAVVDVTGTVIDGWSFSAVAEVLADYMKHLTEATSAAPSLARLRRATAAVADGQAQIADGTKAISGQMDELDRAIVKMIDLSNAFRDGGCRDAALEVAKLGREVYVGLDARRRLWERSSALQLEMLRAIVSTGGDLVKAMGLVPTGEDLTKEIRDRRAETEVAREKCRDAFTILQGKAGQTRF